jgi:hypothetical protein
VFSTRGVLAAPSVYFAHTPLISQLLSLNVLSSLPVAFAFLQYIRRLRFHLTAS